MSIEKLECGLKKIEQEFKEMKKELRKLKKNLNKEKTKNNNPKNNGLNKEYLLSEELCMFLKLEKNSKMSRTKVTKKLLEYIKENKLGNKRDINIDEKLKKLIDAEKVTYFTIQKHMNKHYTYE